jgi:metallo-beta-lactamase class B
MLAFSLALCGEVATPSRAAEPACPACAEWNQPQPPFRIFGNTYYVGVHGLSAILITSDAGHVLIDGGSRESATQIVSSIRSLGFRIEDVRLILNSHAHFDHAGGIAELQRLSGATVAASPWSMSVMSNGTMGRGDPQFASNLAVPSIAGVVTLADREVLRVGPVGLTAHFTPGHTPGGTSWTWQSCEGTRCLELVYADSLTAVASDGFLFTASPDYPNALADFEKSFSTLEAIGCDILITPHPEFSDVFGKLARRERGEAEAFIDPKSCTSYGATMRRAFDARITRERTTGR